MGWRFLRGRTSVEKERSKEVFGQSLRFHRDILPCFPRPGCWVVAVSCLPTRGTRIGGRRGRPAGSSTRCCKQDRAPQLPRLAPAPARTFLDGERPFPPSLAKKRTAGSGVREVRKRRDQVSGWRRYGSLITHQKVRGDVLHLCFY